MQRFLVYINDDLSRYHSDKRICPGSGVGVSIPVPSETNYCTENWRRGLLHTFIENSFKVVKG